MLHFALFITHKGEIITFIQLRKFEVISFQAQGRRENKLEKSVGLGINYHLPKNFLINQSIVNSNEDMDQRFFKSMRTLMYFLL